jgi:methyltransferase (TIGR00027 family)
MKAARSLRNVSDTARWVAYLRALESERSDALFRDPLARRLAGERGRQITKSLPSSPLLWSLAIRTRVFDDWILDTIARERVTTVVNLASGFDARPYRLALPARLRWVEVDLPAIVAEKQAQLANECAACTVERIAVDLADRGARQVLFTHLGGHSEPSLVVTEGLLIYLDEASVASFADDLRDSFVRGIWLLENVAPSILARHKKLFGASLRAASAEHTFAPKDGWEFFRSRGWSFSEPTKSLFDEARRLGRELVSQKLTRWLTPRRYERLRTSVEYASMRPAQQPETRVDPARAPIS